MCQRVEWGCKEWAEKEEVEKQRERTSWRGLHVNWSQMDSRRTEVFCYVAMTHSLTLCLHCSFSVSPSSLYSLLCSSLNIWMCSISFCSLHITESVRKFNLSPIFIQIVKKKTDIFGHLRASSCKHDDRRQIWSITFHMTHMIGWKKYW